jgi:hypothetical protein
VLATAFDNFETPESRLFRASSSNVSNLATASPQFVTQPRLCTSDALFVLLWLIHFFHHNTPEPSGGEMVGVAELISLEGTGAKRVPEEWVLL